MPCAGTIPALQGHKGIMVMRKNHNGYEYQCCVDCKNYRVSDSQCFANIAATSVISGLVSYHTAAEIRGKCKSVYKCPQYIECIEEECCGKGCLDCVCEDGR